MAESLDPKGLPKAHEHRWLLRGTCADPDCGALPPWVLAHEPPPYPVESLEWDEPRGA